MKYEEKKFQDTFELYVKQSLLSCLMLVQTV